MLVVGDVFFERIEHNTFHILAARMSGIFFHSSALLSLLFLIYITCTQKVLHKYLLNWLIYLSSMKGNKYFVYCWGHFWWSILDRALITLRNPHVEKGWRYPLASGMWRALFSFAPGGDTSCFYLSTFFRKVTTLHSNQIMLKELPIFESVLPPCPPLWDSDQPFIVSLPSGPLNGPLVAQSNSLPPKRFN